MSLEDDIDQYTDRLLFRSDSESNINTHVSGWSGPWPPPKVLFTATGYETGIVSVFTPDSSDKEMLARAIAYPTITIRRYTLFSASKQPHPSPPAEHWFRGAIYVLAADEKEISR